jgi:outer membrane protein assembly factor BamB
MPETPSRRDVLAAAGGALAGAAGGYLLRPSGRDGDADSPTLAPLAWADTEWPYPDYDAARTRNPPPTSAPPEDLSETWRVDLQPRTRRAPPVLANGAVFVASRHQRGATVQALDRADGTRRWRHRYLGDSTDDPEILAPGSGVFYRVGGDGETPPFGVFSATTGEAVWQQDRPPIGGWTVAGGHIYYADMSSATLHAFDPRTGQSLWQTSVDADRLVVESYRGGLVYATAYGTLYALDGTDGSVEWTARVPKHTNSGPVLAGGRAVVSKWTEGMDAVALDATTGARQWTYPLSPTTVETDEGMVRRWYEVGAASPSTVLLVERRPDSSAGRLHAVEADTGDRRWRIRPPEGLHGFSKPTLVESDVYVTSGGDRGTKLLRVAAASGAIRETWDVPDGAGPPQVSAGGVFLTGKRELLALG